LNKRIVVLYPTIGTFNLSLSPEKARGERLKSIYIVGYITIIHCTKNELKPIMRTHRGEDFDE